MMRRKRSNVQTNMVNVRAVVMGLDGVGKSALTVRFLTRRFIGEYDENSEMTYRHHLTVDGHYVALDIMDTAGENSEEKLAKCVIFGDVFFILYSITDRFSFIEARRLGRFIRRVKDCDCAMILAGTKNDLQHLRRISEKEGVQLAEELNATFSEISISEGFVETYSLLHDSIRQYLNGSTTKPEENGDKEKNSTLSRMKEGFKGIYTRRKSCSL